MGKRVYVSRLAMGVRPRADGSFALRPHEQYAHLSCGHSGVRVSFFSTQGEPAWCEKCTSSCLACGQPATECFGNSMEWGEACASCMALSEPEWRRRVRQRRLAMMSAEEHIERARHFLSSADRYLREAADPKHKFWRYPKRHPLWWSHTRAGHRASSVDLRAKGVMHALFVLLGAAS